MFRLIQDSLTNARKYAGPGAHVEVVERWGDDGLAVTVRDDGRGAAAASDGHAPGYGLMGMRERVAAVGGRVTAGPGAGGGFEVAAVIPLSPGATGSPDTPVTSHPVAPSTRLPSPSDTPVPSATRYDGAGGTGADPLADSPAAVTDPGTEGQPPSARRPRSARQAAWQARLGRLAASLRSQPLDQVDERRPLNRVERFSRWAQRHYLAVDAVVAATLCLWLLSLEYGGGWWGTLLGRGIYWGSDVLLLYASTVAATAPLAFRRRFPEGSALAAAILSAVQILLFPSLFVPSVLVLVSVYSATLYGRPAAWRWVCVAVAADSWLFGMKLMSDAEILALVFLPGHGGRSLPGVMVGGAFAGLLIAGVPCFAAVAWGRWQRSRGTNALVLRQREEALRAERERQRVLAANMERDRIAATIQAEVAATLTSVADRATEGLAMLDGAAARGVEPEPAAIVAAFAAIGAEGRSALAHMRHLLGVLRETGFSDQAHAGGTRDAMRLAPAAPLEEQLRHAARPAADAGDTPAAPGAR